MADGHENLTNARNQLLAHFNQQAGVLVAAASPFNRNRYYAALEEMARVAVVLNTLDNIVGRR